MERGRKSAMLDGDVILDAQIRGGVNQTKKTGNGSKISKILFLMRNCHKT